MALTPISPNHSPELIDNMYLTSVYSTNSAVTSAFLVYIHIPEATVDDIANILSMQLDNMQKTGVISSADNHTNSMTVHPIMDTHLTTT